MANKTPSSKKSNEISYVFLYAALIVGALVVIGAIFPDQFGDVSGTVSAWVTSYFGWYYMILVALIVMFCIFLVFSPIGKLKLGKPDDEPEFRTISWIAMLFSAGMGIGLVFYGAGEPIAHYLSPPTADGETTAALEESMRSTFLHYGIHAWSIYGIVGLCLAYASFRKGEVGLLSKTLRPLFGDRVDGWLGVLVDVLAVFATVIGVAVSLGIGAIQINGGLNYLFGIPVGLTSQAIIIVAVTVLFLYSAWSGLSKGIQYLSNTNMILAGILFAIILIVGPTMMILNIMTTSTGGYLSSIVANTFDVAPLNPQKEEWLSSWTIYYWGWWMSWSPFVGIFIARVSKGRTIREFIIAVLLVPTVIGIIWFSVFGVTGIMAGINDDPGIFDMATEVQLFAVFDTLPLGTILSIVAILLVSIFFITSADSATFVLGMQTSHGSLNPSGRTKLVWGISLSAIAFTLLAAGGETGLNALQSAAIISALPFSFVLIGMMLAFYKDANNERKYLGLSITPTKERLETYIESSHEEYQEELDAYAEKDKPRGV